MPCHELGWKGSCALSLVTNLGTWAYTAVWERLLKAHDHLIITLRLLISPGWIPKSCADIWPQQAPGGITTKETGVDGVSTQVGSTRASISSHSTVQLQAQPCGLVTAPWSQIAKADHINRLQSRSQMPPCDQIHLCIICLDRPRELAPTQPSGLSGAGDKKQAEKDERWEKGEGQRQEILNLYSSVPIPDLWYPQHKCSNITMWGGA